MKTNIKKINSIILFLLGISIIVSCNKGNEQLATQTEDQNYDELIERSKAMQDHILDFKERMEFYRDNPNVKSGGQLYTADSAVIELESLINYDFCYTNHTCINKEIQSSVIIMPMDDILRINDPKLMETYYNKVIDSIQAQMLKANLSNMKLLAVDIEFIEYDSNNDAIVSITSLIGSQNTPSISEGWIYGENAGLCSTGWYNDEDAATQLSIRVNEAMIPTPPNGCSWSYSIVKIPEEFNNPQLYPLYTGPSDHDNYLDYKIFFAENNTYGNVVLTVGDDERCLMNYEMSFYESYYIDFAIETENEYSLDHYDCLFVGYPDNGPPYHIQHDLTYFVANRFLKCPGGNNNILIY